MEAKCREDVFSALRKQGVKAIKVVAADGSKANGEVRGVRKRMVFAAVVLAALVTGIVVFAVLSRAQPRGAASHSPRHQIYGDPVVMERFERGDFDRILPREGDRMLAWFAEPGKLMCPKGVVPQRPTPRQMACFGIYAEKELSADRDLTLDANEPRETRELKQIVNGMREELRAYLANGNGTPRSFWRRLIERISEEMRIYERVRRELENEKSDAVWSQKNDALRRLGLRTIPNPKED